jgi:Fe-Mn family superoxide dismutase
MNPPSRRAALALSATTVAMALAGRAHAQATTSSLPPMQLPPGPFSLPPLPYAYDKNEAAVDKATMELHHGRHHAAFIAVLNNAVREHGQVAAMKIEDILPRLGEMPEAIRGPLRNAGGGHANHTMFWTVMGGAGGAPTGELAQAITNDLGGFDKLKTDFNARGVGVFGSGWAFVTVDRAGKLALTSTPNQDNPMMTPGTKVLFGNDVWEHAYYLRYQNRRAEYLTNWWNVVDWSKVAERYAAAKAGTLAV